MQQPRVRFILAMFWLAMSVGVVAGTTARPSYLTPDQYSPLSPEEGQAEWKDPVEDQPLLYLSIGQRSSISAHEPLKNIIETKYVGRDLTFPSLDNDASSNRESASLKEGKQLESSTETKFTSEHAGHRSPKAQESSSRDVPPPELEESFVADDTFQDQGPGSVEIYKLDLFKEKAMLGPTPTTKPVQKSKSKTPKKTSHINWKTKAPEYKSTSPKIIHRQSNFFDELQTDIPASSETFGAGGVPELQVGCEGLEASSHKLKRSIDSTSKGKTSRTEVNSSLDVTPISLDLDYELSSEETYEEMDELHRLKKLESTTKEPEKNRGDMDARLLDTDISDTKNNPEILPVRGDLGNSNTQDQTNLQPPPAFILNNQTTTRDRGKYGELETSSVFVKAGRKLLSFEYKDINDKSEEPGRMKRSIWGFGENEGVVTSDELQTENQRRRQFYERRQLEDARRRQRSQNQTQSEIRDIRQEYEGILEQRKRDDEERRRRIQEKNAYRPAPDRWQEEEQQRREEHRKHQEYARRMYEQEQERNYRVPQRPYENDEQTRQEPQPYRKGHDYERKVPTEGEEQRSRSRDEEWKRREQQRREEDQRRRQEYEEARRRYEEEQNRRRLHEDDTRRRQEMQRRRQEGDQRQPAVQSPERNLSPEERRSLEERRREWMLKRQRNEEEERRRQQRIGNQVPSNLQYPNRANDTEFDRRTRDEIERDRKLREYIQRNRPINVSRSSYRRNEDSPQTRRLEEERRRSEPKREPYRNMTQRGIDEENRRRLEDQRRRSGDQRTYQEYSARPQSARDWTQERRLPGEAQYYGRPGTEVERRPHGPFAPGNDAPQSYVSRRYEDERRRREQEELRKEMLKREEETRRIQSRRYEEDRRRQEAVRLEAERRRKELIEEEGKRAQTGRSRPGYARPEYPDHRLQEHRRNQESIFIPANLVLDESRRAAERDRQRQEQERKRHEVERYRQEQQRMNEAREREEYDRVMKEQQRRREEARLNALPVSARIIIRPPGSPKLIPTSVVSRTSFGNEVDFTGINPNREGVQAPRFPVPPTRNPPVKSPPSCVWAVVQCCPTNRNRLVTCFESMGCPGVNWDGNPCRGPVAQAARDEVAKFYAAAERDEET